MYTDQSKIYKEGYLYTPFGNKWKKRYIVLHNQNVFVYKDEKSYKKVLAPMKEVSLETCKCKLFNPINSMKDHSCFRIDHAEGHSVRLSHPNADLVYDWIDFIKSAIPKDKVEIDYENLGFEEKEEQSNHQSQTKPKTQESQTTYQYNQNKQYGQFTQNNQNKQYNQSNQNSKTTTNLQNTQFTQKNIYNQTLQNNRQYNQNKQYSSYNQNNTLGQFTQNTQNKQYNQSNQNTTNNQNTQYNQNNTLGQLSQNTQNTQYNQNNQFDQNNTFSLKDTILQNLHLKNTFSTFKEENSFLLSSKDIFLNSKSENKVLYIGLISILNTLTFKMDDYLCLLSNTQAEFIELTGSVQPTILKYSEITNLRIITGTQNQSKLMISRKMNTPISIISEDSSQILFIFGILQLLSNQTTFNTISNSLLENENDIVKLFFPLIKRLFQMILETQSPRQNIFNFKNFITLQSRCQEILSKYSKQSDPLWIIDNITNDCAGLQTILSLLVLITWRLPDPLFKVTVKDSLKLYDQNRSEEENIKCFLEYYFLLPSYSRTIFGTIFLITHLILIELSNQNFIDVLNMLLFNTIHFMEIKPNFDGDQLFEIINSQTSYIELLTLYAPVFFYDCWGLLKGHVFNSQISIEEKFIYFHNELQKIFEKNPQDNKFEPTYQKKLQEKMKKNLTNNYQAYNTSNTLTNNKYSSISKIKSTNNYLSTISKIKTNNAYSASLPNININKTTNITTNITKNVNNKNYSSGSIIPKEINEINDLKKINREYLESQNAYSSNTIEKNLKKNEIDLTTNKYLQIAKQQEKTPNKSQTEQNNVKTTTTIPNKGNTDNKIETNISTNEDLESIIQSSNNSESKDSSSPSITSEYTLDRNSLDSTDISINDPFRKTWDSFSQGDRFFDSDNMSCENSSSKDFLNGRNFKDRGSLSQENTQVNSKLKNQSEDQITSILTSYHTFYELPKPLLPINISSLQLLFEESNSIKIKSGINEYILNNEMTSLNNLALDINIFHDNKDFNTQRSLLEKIIDTFYLEMDNLQNQIIEERIDFSNFSTYLENNIIQTSNESSQSSESTSFPLLKQLAIPFTKNQLKAITRKNGNTPVKPVYISEKATTGKGSSKKLKKSKSSTHRFIKLSSRLKHLRK
ncbi:tandem ph domain containing protein [Anaeramoeba flamelloides]|uniref:Tandem ph domain containing protein n=1 Tax=Anaeramoeba flamelloides TaxID=1746091 RepID=A0AAV7ZQ04_9EUKA|nr:tandem ph domain containing protein [Anaeramoeba flamelloides]